MAVPQVVKGKIIISNFFNFKLYVGHGTLGEGIHLNNRHGAGLGVGVDKGQGELLPGLGCALACDGNIAACVILVAIGVLAGELGVVDPVTGGGLDMLRLLILVLVVLLGNLIVQILVHSYLPGIGVGSGVIADGICQSQRISGVRGRKIGGGLSFYLNAIASVLNCLDNVLVAGEGFGYLHGAGICHQYAVHMPAVCPVHLEDIPFYGEVCGGQVLRENFFAVESEGMVSAGYQAADMTQNLLVGGEIELEGILLAVVAFTRVSLGQLGYYIVMGFAQVDSAGVTQNKIL